MCFDFEIDLIGEISIQLAEIVVKSVVKISGQK